MDRAQEVLEGKKSFGGPFQYGNFAPEIRSNKKFFQLCGNET